MKYRASRRIILAGALLAASCISSSWAQLWEQTSGPGTLGVACLLNRGATVLAGTSGAGVYRSQDGGTTWAPSNGGIAQTNVMALAGNTGFVFASIETGGVFRSADNGLTWTPATTGIEGHRMLSLLANDSFILAGDSMNGVYKSINNGASWFLSNNGMGATSVGAMAQSGSVLLAAGDNFTYRSTNGGDQWISISDLDFRAIWGFGVSPLVLYAGGFNGVARSTDAGLHWTFVEFIFDGLIRFASFAIDSPTAYSGSAGFPGNGVYKSDDQGLTWVPANAGITSVTVDALALSGSRLLAGTPQKGIMAMSLSSGEWSRSGAGLPSGGNIRDILFTGGAVYAATGGDGVYRTLDAGALWQQVSQDDSNLLQNELVHALTTSGGALFAATASSGVYRSTDSGGHWEQADNGLPPANTSPPLALDAVGPNVVVGTADGIFYSADGGNNWNPTNAPAGTVEALAHGASFAFAIVSTGIFSDTGIYRSSTNGQSWDFIFPAGSGTPISMAADQSFVWVGDLLNGMMRSPDNGDSWFDATPEPGSGVFSILPLGSDLFAGVEPGGQQMYVSHDHGMTWTPFNDGLVPSLSIEALGSDGAWLFAGTDKSAIWRRYLLDPAEVARVITAEDIELTATSPCGISAVVRWQIPGAEEASLALLDPLGRELSQLRQAPAGPGGCELILDTSRIPSGVYFVRLAVGGRTRTVRLVRID